MPDAPALTASLEDYVESIYHIAARQGAARVTDIAADLEVAKSSVTGALRTLSSRGLVNHDPYSIITLTTAGRDAAQRVVRRHAILAQFLAEVLGLPPETAQANACRLEHAMEPKVVDRLLKYIDFIDRCPRAGDEFREGFKRFHNGRDEPCNCIDCLNEAIGAANRNMRVTGACSRPNAKDEPGNSNDPK